MVCFAKLEPQIIIAKVVKELSKVAGEEIKSHKNVAMSLLNCDGQKGNERAESCGGGRGEAPPVSPFFFNIVVSFGMYIHLMVPKVSKLCHGI